MIRPWLFLVVALAISLGLKLAAPGDPPPPADLEAFLAARSSSRPVAVPITPERVAPVGWRFTAAACPARVYPSLDQGDLDASVLARLGAGEQAAFLYRGAIHPAAPSARHNSRLLLWHAGRLVGLDGPRPRPWVLLVYPADCDAALDLDWAVLF